MCKASVIYMPRGQKVNKRSRKNRQLQGIRKKPPNILPSSFFLAAFHVTPSALIPLVCKSHSFHTPIEFQICASYTAFPLYWFLTHLHPIHSATDELGIGFGYFYSIVNFTSLINILDLSWIMLFYWNPWRSISWENLFQCTALATDSKLAYSCKTGVNLLS